jgi:hypothetical protein
LFGCDFKARPRTTDEVALCAITGCAAQEAPCFNGQDIRSAKTDAEADRLYGHELMEMIFGLQQPASAENRILELTSRDSSPLDQKNPQARRRRYLVSYQEMGRVSSGSA